MLQKRELQWWWQLQLEANPLDCNRPWHTFFRIVFRNCWSEVFVFYYTCLSRVMHWRRNLMTNYRCLSRYKRIIQFNRIYKGNFVHNRFIWTTCSKVRYVSKPNIGRTSVSQNRFTYSVRFKILYFQAIACKITHHKQKTIGILFQVDTYFLRLLIQPKWETSLVFTVLKYPQHLVND